MHEVSQTRNLVTNVLAKRKIVILYSSEISLRPNMIHEINAWCQRDHQPFQILHFKFSWHFTYWTYIRYLSALTQYGAQNWVKLAFGQLSDVDCSDGRAVCSTISQIICSSPIFSPGFLHITRYVTHFHAVVSLISYKLLPPSF